MKQQFLSKSDIKKLVEDLQNQGITIAFSKKDPLKVIDDTFYYKGNDLYFFVNELAGSKQFVPSLKILQTMDLLPEVIVDMGAIKFIVNGADIMRPGIVSCSSFAKGSFVAIKDETHKKTIAVGFCAMDSDELMAQTKGIVVKNIHYVGDEIWNR
ncbi:MAG: PUA domain-containing protein [Candidatus Woesearchaeota archaeon]